MGVSGVPNIGELGPSEGRGPAAATNHKRVLLQSTTSTRGAAVPLAGVPDIGEQGPHWVARAPQGYQGFREARIRDGGSIGAPP